MLTHRKTIGYGCTRTTVDYDVVAAHIAEKLRRRMSPLPDERVRIVHPLDQLASEGSV